MVLSNCPRKYYVTFCFLAIVLVQLVSVETRKIPEKSKLANHKSKVQQEGCTEKDGACKSTRVNQGKNPGKNDKGETHVGQHSPSKAALSRHFIEALDSAERFVLDIAQRFLTKYGGLERSDWEMTLVEMMVRTMTKDIRLKLEALQ